MVSISLVIRMQVRVFYGVFSIPLMIIQVGCSFKYNS